MKKAWVMQKEYLMLSVIAFLGLFSCDAFAMDAARPEASEGPASSAPYKLSEGAKQTIEMYQDGEFDDEFDLVRLLKHLCSQDLNIHMSTARVKNTFKDLISKSQKSLYPFNLNISEDDIEKAIAQFVASEPQTIKMASRMVNPLVYGHPDDKLHYRSPFRR